MWSAKEDEEAELLHEASGGLAARWLSADIPNSGDLEGRLRGTLRSWGPVPGRRMGAMGSAAVTAHCRFIDSGDDRVLEVLRHRNCAARYEGHRMHTRPATSNGLGLARSALGTYLQKHGYLELSSQVPGDLRAW